MALATVRAQPVIDEPGDLLRNSVCNSFVETVPYGKALSPQSDGPGRARFGALEQSVFMIVKLLLQSSNYLPQRVLQKQGGERQLRQNDGGREASGTNNNDMR